MTCMTYEQILAELAEAEKWLGDLGLREEEHRIQEHMQRIERLVQARKEGRDEEATEGDEGRLNMFSFTEAMEFLGIFEAFKDDPPPRLLRRLKDALSGPADLAAESTESNQARNIMFELNLAARLRIRGLPVELPRENPDILTEFEGVPIYIQCKRPFKEGTIPARIEDAASQLKRDLDQAGDPKARGVIAISVSRACNPGELLYRGPNEAAFKKGLGDQIQALGMGHRETWGKIEDARIIGIAYHIISPTVAEDSKILVVGQELVVFPLPERPDLELLAKLTKALELNS